MLLPPTVHAVMAVLPLDSVSKGAESNVPSSKLPFWIRLTPALAGGATARSKNARLAPNALARMVIPPTQQQTIPCRNLPYHPAAVHFLRRCNPESTNPGASCDV